MSEVRLRRVTLFVTDDGDDLAFVRESATAATDHYPSPLNAGDLRAAAALGNRLVPDSRGARPVPLLRIHAPSVKISAEYLVGSEYSDQRSIVFEREPRLLAGLIADAALAGVAAGAIVSVPGGVADLRRDIAMHLAKAGFRVDYAIPGWSALPRSGLGCPSVA